MTTLLHLGGHLILVLLLGYYLILNLQWYNYRVDRILLHHHRPWLHIPLFLLPLFSYMAVREWVLAVDLLYGLALFLWLRRIDRRLVFTGRVKRFFGLLLLFTLLWDTLCLAKGCSLFSTVAPLASALLVSSGVEYLLLRSFRSRALERLRSVDPTIVAITGSYGKTSIKNFLYQLISPDFRAYRTPRSVNTLPGIIKDINENLPSDTEVYIVEAGAREPGDIEEIARLLDHHYAIIGKIGPQHIEYFKSLERIILTKLELLRSRRLKRAFLWDGVEIRENPAIVKVGKNIKNVRESLQGIQFDLEIDGEEFHFEAPILGGFNALNIALAVLAARELGVEMESLVERVARLKGVPHRLERIEAGGKVIIDDSFNGNLEGMVASYQLVRGYEGRKIVVTPGIVESGKEVNVKLAEKINEVFDLAIITGKINREILKSHIEIPTVVVEEKGELERVLAKESRPGDLILFSNDTPAYL
ncbi:MAG: UDP-N-acetylmuramoyl-tripeptide--D-alanyl-D-alanine ligase [Epsilonproteobacteria bacterium]|nr:UDP-N-acetylmuramoylalanyl-D-glutamyl-2, 6-diaminopimelate--D-alanyl-D-alanine ligase [Campylobacterota bacterium]NPA56603.1 UDP-N-acetylmuramoyl-tripeptide--D-alanyl-D-alanine ligase [Campylobacterota bacterium]